MGSGNSGKYSGTKGSNNSNSYNGAGSKSVKKVDLVVTTTKHSLSMKSESNSVTQKLDSKGNIITERYYGKDGKAYLDIDYSNHGNSNTHPIVPHEHKIQFYENGKPKRDKMEEINK